MNQLKISESFYSIQGEGKTVGVPAYFLRLTDCNLLCGGKGTIQDKHLHDGAKWRCDSIESWTKGGLITYADIIEYFGELFLPSLESRHAHLVITGGEPLMQQNQLISFCKIIMSLTNRRAFIEIETNGTITPFEDLAFYVSLWNVSPKLSGSGMRENVRFKKDVIMTFNYLPSIMKFVVNDNEDMKELLNTYWPLLNTELRKNTYLMPGVDQQDEYAEISQWVIEQCKTLRVNYGARLQIAIYDQTTGV
jgi:6-pyruvoyltetrahydropterin 2'-reductase